MFEMWIHQLHYDNVHMYVQLYKMSKQSGSKYYIFICY